MFAYVYYVIDKQLAKVPIGYIKKFEREKYDAETVYRVFWSRFIHSIQNDNDKTSMATLGSLREPPAKQSWKVAEGEGFYSAYVLRVEDSLDVLIDSLNKKRPSMPFTQYEDEFLSSTTEDEVGVLKSQKDNKKQEVAEIKKQELTTKRLRAEEIFKAAKKSRKGAFRELDFDSDSDDPEVIPSTKYEQLKIAYDHLEKKNEKIEEKLKTAEIKLSDYQKQVEALKMENAEVVHLRSLNRQLQEKVMDLPVMQGGCCHAVPINQPEIQSDSETTEVELGAGIVVNRKVYDEIFSSDSVIKFTKSLAVVIWGSSVLAERSVKGVACRNRNGPKKTVPGAVQPVRAKPKVPLTPEKLAVVSGQMREYMMRSGKSHEIENELKKRNKYISDKIQSICSQLSKV